MNTQNYPHPYIQDDEIDLFELAEKLWAKKWLIIGTTAIIAALSVAVALLLPAVWQSEIRIYMSSNGDIGSYNSIQSQLVASGETLSDDRPSAKQLFPPLTPEDSYNIFYRHLTSRSTLRQVFEASGLADQASVNSEDEREEAQSLAFNSFQKDFSISRSNGKGAIDSITILYNAETPGFSASLINEHLLPVAEERTRQELAANLNAGIQGEIAKIDKGIVLAENQFIESSRLKTLKLEEALKIAAAGNITRPVNLNSGISSSSQFLLGTDILTTQLSIQKNEVEGYRLTSRPTPDDADKPLLPKVAALFIAKQSLKILDTGLKTLKSVVIDEPAQVPVTPIKPKKRLIVALGVVLGGMLGVFAALIQIAIASRRERQRATTATLKSSALHTEKLMAD